MAKECNCQQCRGDGPPDEPELPEVSDEFLIDWIAHTGNRATIAENCAEEIEQAWGKYLEGQKEERAISRTEAAAERWSDDHL